MRSTRSSASSPGDGRPGPSRTAISILVVLSIAIPAGVLALIVVNDDNDKAAPTPTTEIAPFDTRKAKVGTLAPDFSLASTTGKTVTLSRLRGKPVVIVFFASWCRPCEEELPVLERFARDENGRLTVVGVSFRDLKSDSVDFVRRLRVTFPALLDEPDAPIAERYGVHGLPQTIFVDAKGVVRGRIYGETSRRALQPAISDLLAGRDIRPV